MSTGAVIRVDESDTALRRDRSRARSAARTVPGQFLVPACTDLPGLPAYHAPARCRIRVGEIIAEVRSIARDTSGDILVPSTRALLFVPFSGTTFVEVGDEQHVCSDGEPFFYAGEPRLSVAWSAGMIGLLLLLRRDRLNAAISALGTDGRRLAACAVTLPASGTSAAPRAANHASLEQAAGRIMRLFGARIALKDAISLAAEDALYKSIAERIVTHGEKDVIAPPVRAVSDAMRLIADNHQISGDIEELAARVGVTGQTLRKGFRLCLGMTVKEHIRAVRLEWAHQRLDSTRESRAVAELANAAGFKTAASFSHAYVRRFGESPTQTRARAVQRNP